MIWQLSIRVCVCVASVESLSAPVALVTGGCRSVSRDFSRSHSYSTLFLHCKLQFTCCQTCHAWARGRSRAGRPGTWWHEDEKYLAAARSVTLPAAAPLLSTTQAAATSPISQPNTSQERDILRNTSDCINRLKKIKKKLIVNLKKLPSVL